MEKNAGIKKMHESWRISTEEGETASDRLVDFTNPGSYVIIILKFRRVAYETVWLEQ